MKKYLVCILLVSLTSVFVFSCKDKEPDKTKTAKDYDGYSEKELWEVTLENQDVETFNIFVEKFPGSEHVLDAKRSLRELWDDKTKQMTPLEMSKLTAVIETDQGTIKFKFYPDQAPDTSRNFIKLAMSHFYDGLTFYRVVPGFVIQGGDPHGNGLGGPGYEIKAEFSNIKHVEGTVAMARGPQADSAGSQFYICLGPQPLLDRKYTIFGQVSEGMSTVNTIGKAQTDPRTNVPAVKQFMKKVYIEGFEND